MDSLEINDHGLDVLNGRYLSPKRMLNNSPKPLNIAIQAIILHTFGGLGSANEATNPEARVANSWRLRDGRGGAFKFPLHSLKQDVPIPQKYVE